MSYLYLLLIFGGMFFVCRELEQACHATAFRFGIPESIAGATLLAVASSAPEFFTSFLGAVIHSVFEMGLLTILWSAIFNITVIPGLCALFSPTPLTVYRTVLVRDCVAYAAMTLLLIGLIGDGILSRFDALILAGAYGLYVYVLYLMLDDDEKVEPVELSTTRLLAGLIGGTALIGLLCHWMILVGKTLALAWAVPISLVGALVFAPGTSVPDMLLSIFASQRGAGSASVSNAFGSNSFDLSICLAAPVLVVGDVKLDMSQGIPESIFMLVASVILAMLFVRTSYELSKREGIILIGLFCVFVTLLVLVV